MALQEVPSDRTGLLGIGDLVERIRRRRWLGLRHQLLAVIGDRSTMLGIPLCLAAIYLE
jgi:hypothetical protein